MLAHALRNVDTSPTAAQKSAGNYSKGHVTVHGFNISIETPRGSIRRGVDRNGKPWAVTLPAHYGYFKRTEGADGDNVDVYLGPHLKSPKVFVVDQIDAETGKFDEHKAMLGFAGFEQAKNVYLRAFSDGKGQDRIGCMTEMGLDQFKRWLEEGDTQESLAAKKAVARAAGGRVSFADGGLVEAGNIDLMQRPVVRNPDGTISTVRSMSIGTDRGETLIPTVSDDGRVLSNEDAIALFNKSGRHLGIFSNIDAANSYARQLHEDQQQMYDRKKFADGGAADDWQDVDDWEVPNETSALKQAFASGQKQDMDALRVAGNLREDPTTQAQKQLGGQFLQGVPVLGAFTDQAGAAISAAVNPLTGVGDEGGTVAERYAENVANEKADREAFERQHPYVSTGMQLAGGMAALGPVASTVRGAHALGVTGPSLLGRVGRGAVTNAALGATDALARGHDPTLGAGIGFASGVAAPLVASGIGRVISPVRGRPERDVLANTLRNEGVIPTAGQASGSRPLRWAESSLGDMPLSGRAAGELADRQGQQFTRAALRRAGIDAPLATADVIDTGAQRLSNQFESLSARNTLRMDRPFGQDIGRVLNEYDRVLNSQQREIVNNVVQDLFAYPRGQIPGHVYQAARSQLSSQSHGLANSDPMLSGALGGIRDALDKAMGRSISPADQSAWQTARRQWGNLKTIKLAVSGAGERAAEGYISPSQLRTAVATRNRSGYARGRGDLTELARAGEGILRPLPNSGTAPRAYMQHAVGSLGAGIAGGLAGGWAGDNGPGALTGAILGAVGPGLAGRALLSGVMQGYLGNRVSQSQRAAIVRGLFSEAAADQARRQIVAP